MADLYASYSELAAAETEGVDYERRSVPLARATWCSIAIHGGGIEGGSGELARAVAPGLMSHYEFAGLKNTGNGDLHVTSTNFDEPQCEAIVHTARRCLSFHGYSGTPGVAETAIGGLDEQLVAKVTQYLVAAGFTVIDAPSEIAGDNPANICNETTTGAGVQLELSRAQREAFFPGGDLSRAMRDSGQRTPAFDAYVAAVRRAYLGHGVITLGSINNSRYATVPYPSPDVDLTAAMATDKLATGGSHFLHLVARYADTNNSYLARLALNTDQSITLTLRKRVGGTETLLATAAGTGGLTHAAGRRFRVRFRVTGGTLRAKVWRDGGTEPDAWSVTTSDSSLSAAGAVGIRAILSVTNTNSLPVTAKFAGFQQLTPQRMHVVRSANGIVKAHAAGADVRLANPMRLAL
ncbi:poly-gamma-glutamate hydrolase family protein [Streptomyces sp. NPDC096048]|uniref:poly-gamma-glutamate hydrolase family protein n=1 Tax=Streptomyces sp. NPDC096048 TaxID=3366072 RepID=UPI0038260036